MTKTVLITGCSTGFGRATAQRFIAAGWNVIATMRTPSPIEGAFVAALDVQDQASITAAVAAGIAKFGAIDVLVNNAGFGLYGILEATPRAKILEQFEVNVFGLLEVTRAVLPHMRAQRSGVILNITSGAGVFGLPMMSMYAASKFAVEGLSESLSFELASLGIVVKLIEPGGVLDSQFTTRSGAEAATTSVVADYAPFLAKQQAVMDGLRNQRAGATSDDVASVIFDAATDGTDRLRYVATPQIQGLVDARRSTSEEQYIALMRRSFGYERG